MLRFSKEGIKVLLIYFVISLKMWDIDFVLAATKLGRILNQIQNNSEFDRKC